MNGDKSIKTFKVFAAIRQIQAAIHHFKNDDYECAVTLAAAAEGVLPNVRTPHLFTLIKASPEFRDIDPNFVINWFKHSVPPYEIEIPEFEVVMVIVRAISKLIAVEKTAKREGLSDHLPDIRLFLRWAFEQGHLPMPDEI
jgi:hypothetical protein